MFAAFVTVYFHLNGVKDVEARSWEDSQDGYDTEMLGNALGRDLVTSLIVRQDFQTEEDERI